VLVLAGLGAAYFLTRDDDEPAATTSAATTSATTAAERVPVPDVVGQTVDEATAAVQAAGFEVEIALVPSDESAGNVVAQDPAAGDEAEEGSSVRLNVAREPDETTTTAPATTPPATTATTSPTTTAPPEPQPAIVPDVVGQELADAARSFADEGLRVSVRYVPSNEAQGRVVAQAQPAGTELRRGDTVQVNVSNGAEPQPAGNVPRVVGQSLADARSALDAAGYEVLAVNLQDEVRNEDRVVSQTPGGGASVPRGSLVVLYVTR
jgi:serine/threonine-protein kinase